MKIRVKKTNLEQKLLDYELVETGLEEREDKDYQGSQASRGNKEVRKEKVRKAIKESKKKSSKDSRRRSGRKERK